MDDPRVRCMQCASMSRCVPSSFLTSSSASPKASRHLRWKRSFVTAGPQERAWDRADNICRFPYWTSGTVGCRKTYSRPVHSATETLQSILSNVRRHPRAGDAQRSVTNWGVWGCLPGQKAQLIRWEGRIVGVGRGAEDRAATAILLIMTSWIALGTSVVSMLEKLPDRHLTSL